MTECLKTSFDPPHHGGNFDPVTSKTRIMKTFLTIGTIHGGIYFSLAYLAAFAVAAGLMIRFGWKRGYPMNSWLLILLSGVIFFIIGDKISTWSQSQWTEALTTFKLPATDNKNALGGVAGMFAGILLAKMILRFNRPVFDSLAFALPLALALSRIGCHLAGCCFGTPTSLPFGITYDQASYAYQAHFVQGIADGAVSAAVHPVQLYQVAGCLLVAVIVWFTRKSWKRNGSLFLVSVLCYLVMRFFTEFFTDPGTSTLAARLILGLNIMQVVILAALLPLALTLLARERVQNPAPAILQQPEVRELRTIILSMLLTFILITGSEWFDTIEKITILLFLLPVVGAILVQIYQNHTVAGFRWLAPALLICSIAFMSQKSIPAAGDSEKVSFTEIGLAGMFGRYSEELQQVNITSDCGAKDYSYESLNRQAVPMFQTGLGVSWNKWNDKYKKMAVGGLLFYGEDYPEDQRYSDSPSVTVGISPYFTFHTQYVGFRVGFSVGQMKTPIGKPEGQLSDGEIISKGHSNAVFIPAGYLRLGPSEFFYAEGSFPGSFPFASPFPTFKAGFGTGLGKTDGTDCAIGFSTDAIYARLVYPIQNTFVIQAHYAENFNTGDRAQRAFVLGLSYRIFSDSKTSK
jgi:phosphatidylglycerol:prolipoprotein diacylglycerol transferase